MLALSGQQNADRHRESHSNPACGMSEQGLHELIALYDLRSLPIRQGAYGG
jgi:hypothetical protein